jgi:hypothetical protein
MTNDQKKTINHLAKQIWFAGFMGLLAFLTFSVRTASASALAKPSNNLNLVGYWSFNDGTSTKATDSSGNGNTGVLTASPTWSSGKFSRALSFSSSSSQYVSVADTSSIRVASGDFTVAGWINPTSLTAHDTVFSKVNSGGSIRELYFTFISPTSVFVHIGESNAGTQTLSTGFSTGVWQHLAISRSGSSVTVYRNGVSVATMTISGTTTNTSAFRIGGRAPDADGNNFWSGGIDEFRVYNRALGPTEITALYNAGATKSIVATNTGLVGYWSLDDATGTTATDSSGKGSTGTLTNGPVWAGAKLGKGLKFDGGNDFVNLGNVSALNVEGSPFSVSAWVLITAQPTSTNAFSIITKGQGGGGGGGWAFIYYSDNLAGFTGLDLSKQGVTDQTVAYTLQLNRWYHVAAVQTASQVEYFVNGVSIGTKTNASAYGSSATKPANIGANNSSVAFMKGSIDDVRVYNRALSATEISTLYSAGETKINSSTNALLTSGLVGLWSFNGQDIRGIAVYDRSGQNNTGTITGSSVPISGKLGQSLSFPGGSGNYVSVIPSGTLKDIGQAGTSYSVTLWFKPKPLLSGEYNLVQKEAVGSGIQSVRIVIESDGNISARLYDGTNFPLNAVSYGNNNEWHFLYVEYIRGSTIGISVDGGAVTTAADTTSGSLTSSNENLGIGAKAAFEGGTNGFNGLIDDVRIYSRVLSNAEVLQLYAMGK